jgi:MFS family permease
MLASSMLYLNLASFLPLFVEKKFGNRVTTVEISYCIIAFEFSAAVSNLIHARTIHMMGRKNAILIGFTVITLSLVSLALVANVSSTDPKVFVYSTIFIRLIQGYGDSLITSTCYSVVPLIWPDNASEIIGVF